MQIATVRDFKIRATKYLASKEEVMVTRYGKPIAVVTPVANMSVGAVLLEIRRIFKEAGISKKEALAALESARREVYGRKHP